jgi:hypothetical protein
MAMIAITTSSSIRVNAARRRFMGSPFRVDGADRYLVSFSSLPWQEFLPPRRLCRRLA